uniref:Uncharacterized protein n=1 Tax=Arundo donax TaxID=35708 RepID=A0A0A8ZKB2_ARUDO
MHACMARFFLGQLYTAIKELTRRKDRCRRA